MAGVSSHEDLVTWQLCRELKLAIYDLIRTGPVTRDPDLCNQLARAARSAPRAIAEGFGRYLPGDFIRYLRYANGEVKEVLDALQDGMDRRYFTKEQVEPLQRLAKRATRAIGNFITYLRTATPPNEEPRRSRAQYVTRASKRRQHPAPAHRQHPAPAPPAPSEPSEPPEPAEPNEPQNPKFKKFKRP